MVISQALQLHEHEIASIIKTKSKLRKGKQYLLNLQNHRDAELKKMSACFSSTAYKLSRQAFVYKYRQMQCRKLSIPDEAHAHNNTANDNHNGDNGGAEDNKTQKKSFAASLAAKLQAITRSKH